MNYRLLSTLLIVCVAIATGCSSSSTTGGAPVERKVEDFHATWKNDTIHLSLNPGIGIVKTKKPTSLHMTQARIEKSDGGFVVSFLQPERKWKATLNGDGTQLELVAIDDGEKVTLTKSAEDLPAK